jgi:hypothetical protein
MPARRTAHDSTYQLKISIAGTRPPVWRRVRVPGRATLGELHEVIQTVLGWTSSHLHQFEIGGNRYGEEPDGFPELEALDERQVTLSEAVGKRVKRFLYVYDFGDDWRHEVVVEKIEPATAEDRPVCLAGKRRRPPEDCGGPWGYANFLKAIQDPNHPQHQELLEWTGDRFDPEEFHLDRVNAILSAAGRGKRIARR